MNNLIFNTQATELLTTIGNASLTIDGSVTISNSITIANASLTVGGSVTISNAALTVGGSVTVSNPITIANTSLTVEGSVTINNSVTIANATITTLISGSAFTANSVTSTVVSGAGNIFNNTDISAQKVASIFVYNKGANALTVSLQLSPTTDDGNYVNDPAYSNISIAGNQSEIIAISKFGQYARLHYEMGATTGTLSAYYNAQA